MTRLIESLDETYEFGFERYERPFKVPLKTHYGDWSIRQGIFVYLRDRLGTVGLGEISPLPWFGTESFEAAIALCTSLPRILHHSDILAISDRFPAVQFGLGTACESLQNPPSIRSLPCQTVCGLLPAGEQVLTAWNNLWAQGHRTFKWKIGVEGIEQELLLFQSLMTTLPSTAKLRLDANGGLSFAQAQSWVKACNSYQDDPSSPQVEYLEQPLPPDPWQDLLDLAPQSQTAIALDESVATVMDLFCWQERGWPGIFIVKPAIMGFPQTLREVCAQIPNPKVFSSVFEADVGRQKSLDLAAELATPDLALGFGVDHWLAASPKISISNSIFS